MSDVSAVSDVTVSEVSDDLPDTDLSPAVEALEREFAVMFSKVRSQIRERAVQVHPDLSPAGYNVVAALVRSGPQHAGSLAAQLFLDKSMMSRLVKQLMELRLVERRADPDDGRAFFIAATGAAVEKVDAVRTSYRRQIRQFLADWDVADVEQLTGLLRRLNGDV